MASLVVKLAWFLPLLALAAGYGYHNLEYRFDYEFNKDAGGWLKYHVVPITWADARMQCHAEGAVLASPLTDQLRAAIVSFVKKQTNIDNEAGVTIFTGVHSTYSKGVYTSIEGVPLLRLSITWAPGEPDNYDNSESCLIMMVGANGTVADASCERVLPYVCYKKKKKDTFLTITECGTTDRAYVMENRTGSCYKLHTRIRPWSDAYRTCEAEGGYLAIINSALEAEVVSNIIASGVYQNYFSSIPTHLNIGYHDLGKQQNFMTIHGQTLDEAGYQQWLPGAPNNVTQASTNDFGEQCGAIESRSFNDIFCNVPLAFLCEMTPNSLRFDNDN